MRAKLEQHRRGAASKARSTRGEKLAAGEVACEARRAGEAGRQRSASEGGEASETSKVWEHAHARDVLQVICIVYTRCVETAFSDAPRSVYTRRVRL